MSKKTFTIIGVVALIIGAVMLLLGGNSEEDMTTTGAYVNASLGGYLSGNVYTTAYQGLVNKLGTGNVKSVTDTDSIKEAILNN